MFRIRRFGVVRTATLGAAMYAIGTLIIVVPVVIIVLAAGPMEFTDSFGRTAAIDIPVGVLLLAPVLYGLIGWIVTALVCLLYNLAAMVTGGVEIQLQGEAVPASAPRVDLPPTA